MPPKRIDPAIRYHAKVDKRGPDECWLWTASRHKNGYGQFHDGDTQVTAHRFGYRLLRGSIPPGHGVLHTCDNPPCQNPNHWFTGTQKHNAEDRERKQRGNRPRGEQVRHARLTEADVVKIRERYRLGEAAQSIADDYEVSVSHVYGIAKGLKWGHVPRPPVTRRRNGGARLSDDDVREIRRERARGVTLHLLSERFGTTMSNICHIALRRSRADVPDEPEDHSAAL